MNSRTLDAIGACTRTLSGISDADTFLPFSEAVTVGPLRAFADRVALRRRFRDDRVDALHRPHHEAAADLYDALSMARLDALGVNWLAGVKKNLLAYPGTDDDGVRWLAFECFSGAAVPREKAGATLAARSALTPGLLEALAALTALLSDHAGFAAAAAVWSAQATGHAPMPSARDTARRFNIPRGSAGVDPRQGRFARPSARREQVTRQRADEGHGSTGAAHEAVAALAGYRVFTRDFDRIVNAEKLATRDELAALRLQLENDFRPMRSLVSRLSKRLLRVLMAKQTREWRFDLDDGLLDQSRLAVFVASGGAARPFKQEFESPFPSTAVTLLIDHSGSMKGRPMKIAALTVEIIARVLERCGVKCEVLGFTTREWDGGEPGRLWAAAGYPEQPGRLNALEHIVIKAADTPWRRARPALGLFLRDDILKENIDGEALAWAHQRLAARPERRRILIVVSDGMPTDEATCAANGFDYLDGHLAAVVRYIERQSSVQLAAIGIGHDVSTFYRNATRISRVDDLGQALTDKLTALLQADS